MDIQKEKTNVEFNKMQKLHKLIQELVTNYPEMVFLLNAQENVKILEDTLMKDTKKEALKDLNIMKEYFVYKDKFLKEKGTMLKPKPFITPYSKPNKDIENYFHCMDDAIIPLKTSQSILLYETLLEQECVLNNEDAALFNIIKEGILLIYNTPKGNLETELIKFLNVEVNTLVTTFMNEFNTLIKHHPNKKDYNVHSIRFKLTNFCFMLGDLFLKIFLETHEDLDVKNTFNLKNKEALNNYSYLLENLATFKHLKNNLFFLNLFKLEIITKLVQEKDNIQDNSLGSETIQEEEFTEEAFFEMLENLELNNDIQYLTNNTFIRKKNSGSDIKKQEYLYKIGQYFYTILRTALLTKDLNSLVIETALLKNKLLEYKIKIGSVFIHAFKKVELFRENIVWEKKNKETILLVPNIKFFPNIIHNIVHQRPYFAYETLESLISKYSKEKNAYNTKNYYIYNICLRRYNLRIHKNPDIALKLSSKNTYEKFRLFTGKHYFKNFERFTSFIGTIDREYYYQFLLMLKDTLDLKKNLKKVSFEENLAKFSNIFKLYRIKPLSLLKVYKENDIKQKRLLEHLFEYALDFHTQDTGILLKEIEITLRPLGYHEKESVQWVNYKKSLKFFKDLYNRLFSYKIFLRGLLTECFIYSHFDYFILDAFIDSRGRHYLNGFYMNPQSYPIIKAFVKPYVMEKDILTNKQFEYISKIAHENTTIIDSMYVANLIKSELSTYENYLEQDQLLKIKNLYDLFENTELSLEDLKTYLVYIKNKKLSERDLFVETLDFVKKYMNNSKLFFVLHSSILLYLNPKNKIANYYELDATASGLQMTAMVLRDANLGELCNLTFFEESKNLNNDIYIIFSKASSFYLYKLFNTIPLIGLSPEFMRVTFKLFSFFQDKKIKFKFDKHKIIINLFRKLKSLLASECYSNYYSLLDILKEFKWLILYKFSAKQENFIHLIERALKIEQKNTVVYELFYNVINIFGGFMYLDLIIYKNKEYSWFMEWLSNREVFKKAIMTFGYNATSYRRKEHFFNGLLEQNENKNSKTLRFFVQLIENLFMKLKDIYLPSSQILRDFGTLLANNVKSNPEFATFLNIDNGIFKIRIKSYLKKSSSIVVSGLLADGSTWHELQINHSLFKQKKVRSLFNDNPNYSLIYKAFDPITLARKFAPNFIHSMDAWLICLFKYKVFLLNKLLKKTFFINNFTNHDTFSITLAPFLKYILMDIYKSLYFFDYLRTLEKNYGYNSVLHLWYRNIMKNKNIRKLNFREELHLGSPVSLCYKYYNIQTGYKIVFDMGSTTNLILNPFFVK